MTWLFDWIVNFIFQIAGYFISFLTFLYNYSYQLVVYLFAKMCEWFFYSISWIVILFLYLFDLFLQCIVYILYQLFGGDVLGAVGLTTDVIEDNMDAILAVAPYAKMCAYVLNLDALYNAIHVFMTFLVVWVVYRWLRVWIRG